MLRALLTLAVLSSAIALGGACVPRTSCVQEAAGDRAREGEGEERSGTTAEALLGTGGQCPPAGPEPLPPCNELAYHVDAARGSDSNPGSSASPWRSLVHARRKAPSAATICVKTGNYGFFSEGTPPRIAQRHVIRAAPGEAPTLSGIGIGYSSRANANLTLSGFVVRGATSDIVTITNATGVHLYRSFSSHY